MPNQAHTKSSAHWFALVLAAHVAAQGLQAAPRPQEPPGKLKRLMFSPEEIPGKCRQIESLFPVDAQTRTVYGHQIPFLPPLLAKRHQSFQCGSQKGTIYYFLYASTGHAYKALDLVQNFLWGGGGPSYLHPSITLSAHNAFMIFSFAPNGRKLVAGPAKALWDALQQKVKDLEIAEANEVQKLKQELGDHPGDFGRRVQLGKAILNSGDSKAAMIEFRAALELEAESPVVDEDLGAALTIIGESYGDVGRAADGVDALRMALLVNPTGARAYLAMGRVCSAKAAYFDQGVRTLRKFLQEIPQTEKESAKAGFYLARILEQQGKEREAIESYEGGLIADPEDHFILNNVAWLYVTAQDRQLRDPQKAVRYAEKAVQAITGPDRPNYLETLALAYYENDQLDEAVSAIQEALALEPNNKPYQESLRKFEQAQERAKRGMKAIKAPDPILTVTGTEYYEVRGKVLNRFRLKVQNWSEFPAEMFAPAPDLPPCGSNTQSSRTWVTIYSEDGGNLYGFCDVSRSSGDFWFAVPKGNAPPDRVYIVLLDRLWGEAYKSNLASTHPQPE